MVRIGRGTLVGITDVNHERNMYVHPNPMARHIFWQRLECIMMLLRKHMNPEDRVLDFGGGSGVLTVAMSPVFDEVHVVDPDSRDAFALCRHFGRVNVRIFEEKIEDFQPELPYDAVVVADVLEHFKDLSMPGEALIRVLRRDGLLFFSLPTENWLYRLGRVILRKKKPADHFHSSDEVLAELGQYGFSVVETMTVPRIALPIPLFKVGVLRLFS